jgi:hypothetical protein
LDGFGVKNRSGVNRLNVPMPVSPVFPVTVTVNVPLDPDATSNDPDIEPPDTVHDGFEMRPLGDEVMLQLVSPEEKPNPVIVTGVPG